MRNMVFVSHANPEDNEFTRWLALRLASEGYPVWCDLTKLLGGETFWEDIDDAIRHHTAKFLFVMTKHSNRKKSPLDELSLATDTGQVEKIKDFVIPLRLDNLRHHDMYVQIRRLNAIDFSSGWLAGFRLLLKKLHNDGAPKDRRFSHSAVTEWWRGQVDGSDIVKDEPEDYYTNWFRISAMPDALYFHRTALDPPESCPYPSYRIADYLLSFAPVHDLDLAWCKSSQSLTEYALKQTMIDVPLTRAQRTNAVTNLLQQAWDRMLKKLSIPTYPFASGRLVGYFTSTVLDKSRIGFQLDDGFKGRRALCGKMRNRHWHFAISARPKLWPEPHFIVNTHVLFSDNGKDIWESKKRLHSTRRSHCSGWWNDDWRDRLFAAMFWLAKRDHHLLIPVARSTNVQVQVRPLCLTSPVSYDDALARRSDVWQSDVEIVVNLNKSSNEVVNA